MKQTPDLNDIKLNREIARVAKRVMKAVEDENFGVVTTVFGSIMIQCMKRNSSSEGEFAALVQDYIDYVRGAAINELKDIPTTELKL